MKRFKIYTENKNTRELIELVKSELEAATIYFATGIWQGSTEESMVIEYITSEVDAEIMRRRLRRLMEKIKIMNRQEAVMLTIENVQVEFV